MPGDDLVPPSADRSAEAADLERHLVVGEVTADLGDPRLGKLHVGVVVDLTDDFLSVIRP